MTSYKGVLSLVLLLAAAPLALGQGTYTQISVPGAVSTFCLGIDATGDISGAYTDASSNTHGFILSGGSYTTVDYPGSEDTVLYGINNVGQVVGYPGFMYSIQTGTFTDIIYPGAGSTLPRSINDAGTVVGYAAKTVGSQSYICFEFDGSTYTKIRPPGATTTNVNGITALGAAVGEASVGPFWFDRGRYRKIVVSGVSGAVVQGVSPAGDALVGWYAPVGMILGFVYHNNAFQTLQWQTSPLTEAFGANDSGEVVGIFIDASENDQGFLWTPPADAGKK